MGVWDGSLIENKLYEAIQLPKPRARGMKNKKRNRAKKEETKTIQNAGSKIVSTANTKKEADKSMNNGHADVFAMFGEMFTNGTKPDKRSENVEDVLSNSSSTTTNKQKNTIKSDPLDIFGFLGDENANDHTQSSKDD